MALLPLSASFPGMQGLRNLVRGHATPEWLPAHARGAPPENAVPGGTRSPLSSGDVVELAASGEPPGSERGGPAVSGSGLYSLSASSLSLGARSLSMTLSASGRGSARGAPGVLRGALGASGAVGGGSEAMTRLRAALEELGLGEREIRDLLMLAALVGRLDPEALEKFADAMKELAGAVSGTAGEAPSPAPAPWRGAAGSFRLDYASLSISVTEVQATVAEADGAEITRVSARRFELRFERLEISMSGGLPEGDPIVLDVAGDGMNLREIDDGVVFDLTGGGRPVRTAFVTGDDALLFYDANLNGLLDSGAELVGNRVEGLDGMEELAAMDDDGDGRVDAADAAWDLLRLFQDRDGDGRVSPLEVALLEDLGISGLSALWEADVGSDGEGLRRAGTSSFTREDGTRGLMVDYWFGYRPA